MIVGNPAEFAIHSHINEAYESLGFMGWGFFTIHVGGIRYGVFRTYATGLACPWGEVGELLDRRGRHRLTLFQGRSAEEIANALLETSTSILDESGEELVPDRLCGLAAEDIWEAYQESKCDWDPGDRAFDDGSRVLFIDEDDSVRVIAYRSEHIAGLRYKAVDVSAVVIPAEQAYGVLREWREAFLKEWEQLPKVPETLGKAVN
ncbi:MAG: Imm42 family immunity protein [Planctomycetota bacterium]